jgi:hypothetical protein
MKTNLRKIPLFERKIDLIILGFFLFALPVVYFIDLEQISVPNYEEFKKIKNYPLMPPPFMVDVIFFYKFR